MYNVYLRLIGKCIVVLLLVLIEFFLLDVTAEVLQANWHLGSNRVSLVQNSLSPSPSNHSSCQKTGMNDFFHVV